MLKKIMFGALLLVLAVSARAGSAETCGRNVKYEYDGNKVIFSPAGNEDAFWEENCNSALTENITELVIEGNVYTQSAKEMFKDAKNIQTMDLKRLRFTDKATDLSSMFSGCSSLESLDLSGWNIEPVTDMSSMFSGCNSLKNLDMHGWNTGYVTNMSSMFSGCSSLESLDLSGWNPCNVTNMSSMFSGCSALHTLTLKIEFFNMDQFFSSLPDHDGPWYYAEKGEN